MKTIRTIGMAVLISVLGTATAAWAQPEQACWRIVNGKGAGVIVSGPGLSVNTPDLGAEGFIAEGHFTDCECENHDGHYHGTLFGIEDPDPDGCGWGCVDRVPCNVNEALDDIVAAIDEIDDFAPGLADKLIDILDAGSEALPSECYSVLLGDASAFGDELFGARANQQVTDEQIKNLLDAFMAWVNRAMDSMTNLPSATNNMDNTNTCCEVSLVRRKGSGAQTKFLDVKNKLNADVGEVVALDVDKCPEDGTISWQYDFKSAPAGDVEPGTGISFTDKRFCVIAERPTTVKVTVTIKCPNGKTDKDTVTIVYR